MQTGSPTLAAAIDAAQNEPLVRVLVDWDNKGSFGGPGVEKQLAFDRILYANGALSPPGPGCQNVLGTVQSPGTLQEMGGAGINGGAGDITQGVGGVYSYWFAAPGTFTGVRWDWLCHDDPAVGNEGRFWALQGAQSGGPGDPGWYCGPQTKATLPTGYTGKVVLFSMWSAVAAATSPDHAQASSGSFGGEGEGQQAYLPYAWVEDVTYTMRIVRDLTLGPRWWTAYIKNTVSGVEQRIGSIQQGPNHGNLKGEAVQWTEHYSGTSAASCALLPYGKVYFGPPVFSNPPLDDLSLDVKRLRVTRALTTDLPAQARPYTGLAAATAELDLARDDGGNNEHAAWHYSPWNTASPLYGKDRKGAPARVEVGYRTDAGPEYVRLLTGRIHALGVGARSRVAKLEIVDPSEALRKQVTLPAIVADDLVVGAGGRKPGLSGTFLADWVLRQCGYYASPPRRPGCVLMATMHGSGWPELGSIQDFHAAGSAQFAFTDWPTFASIAPKWVTGIYTGGESGEQIDYVLSSSLSVNNGGTMFYQGWIRPENIAAAPGGSPFAMAYRTGFSSPWVTLWIDNAGRLQCTFNRGGTDAVNRTTATAGPTGFVDDVWYYVALYAEFKNGSVDIWLRKDNTWSSKITVAAGSTTTSGPINTAAHARGKAGGFADAWYAGYAESVQWTGENGAGAPPAADDAFVPTARIMPSLNQLIATPVLSEQPGAILRQLAEAELGMSGFDEFGVPFFRSRKYFTTPPQTTSQRTLRATADLKDLASDESVDSVVNRVVVTASPPEVQATSDVYVQTGPGPSIGPNTSRTYSLRFRNPVFNLDTQVISHGSATQSRYNASTARDGSGSVVPNLTFAFSKVGAQACLVTITNPNAYWVYLVGNSGVAGVEQGKASFRLRGQFVLFDQQVNTQVRQEASDAASIAKPWGEQLYEYPPNPFLQDLDSVGTLAADLVAQLKNGPPTLSDVRIVADPRLQLGDRATIEDAKGLGIAGQDFHLAEITTEVSEDSGLVQSVGTRAV
jgi:hypothetical protein